MRKQNNRPPTIEEFLRFKPKRLDFEWHSENDKLVSIKVPKFTSSIGITFCRIIKKDETFTANLDKIGSFVWKLCDGGKTVEDILKKLEKEFTQEKNLDQRLFLFLQQMKNLGYIEY